MPQPFFQQLLGALAYGSSYPLVFNTVLFAGLFTLLYGFQLLLARWGQARIYLLLAFSLYFYYKASGYSVLLLMATAAFDFWAGQRIHTSRRAWQRNAWLYASVVLNLGQLLFFKYANFFIASYFGLANPSTQAPVLQILLPVGISFYTFKTLSYVLDVHREEIEHPENNYLHYLFYLSFFPNILAGPITRAAQFLPQVRLPFGLTKEVAGRALFLFLLGLFKKMVIADYLAANFVDRVFDSPGAFTGFENLTAAATYGLQLYADFSGYTDMAIGVALLLGFDIGINFREPFKAQNISDFWRRWHISLSSWFNDYVFIPLSFSWRSWGNAGVVPAVLLTFLLSGLWHGPAWTYVLWGLSHGLAIAYETVSRSPRRFLARHLGWFWVGLSVLLTYSFLSLTYILFRAEGLEKAGLMAGQILYHFSPEVAGQWALQYSGPLLVIGLALVLHYFPTRGKAWVQRAFVATPWPLQALLFAVGVVLIYQVKTAALQPFIYLQF